MENIDFLHVLIAVVSLVLLAVPGYVLVKCKLLKKGAAEAFSTLVLYGCQPMLMIMGFQKTAYDPKIGLNMLIVAGLAFLVHFVMIGLVYLIIRNKDNDKKKNVARFASVFGNCGYMGLPFLQMLFSGTAHLGEILIYTSVVIAVFNLLTWSIGIFMITGDRKDISVKKALLNPTIIGVAVGMILFFAVKTPIATALPDGTVGHAILSKLMQSINFLAETVTPLAMVVVGIKLADVKIKDLFLDKWAYITAVLKLILMSVLSMIAVAFLPVSSTIKFAIFFTLSMPSATNTVMFSVQFGGDGDSASVMVLLSTIFSIVTIPLTYLAFTGIFGVAI